MLKKTQGIVLKSSIFGEADLIVTYLTRDYGLVRVFAKSPRKAKSRFGSSLEPLTYAGISFLGKEQANLPRLTQSDIIRPFHALRDDYMCLLRIVELIEMNLNFLIDREPHPDIFGLLLNALSKIESDSKNKLYYLYYKIRFLEIAGYSPRLDLCGRCGCAAAKNGHHNFYISHGAILCHNCVAGDSSSIKVSESALKFYKSIFKWHYSTIDRIKAPDGLLSEIDKVVSSHIAYISGPAKTFNKNLFVPANM